MFKYSKLLTEALYNQRTIFGDRSVWFFYKGCKVTVAQVLKLRWKECHSFFLGHPAKGYGQAWGTRCSEELSFQVRQLNQVIFSPFFFSTETRKCFAGLRYVVFEMSVQCLKLSNDKRNQIWYLRKWQHFTIIDLKSGEELKQSSQGTELFYFIILRW